MVACLVLVWAGACSKQSAPNEVGSLEDAVTPCLYSTECAPGVEYCARAHCEDIKGVCATRPGMAAAESCSVAADPVCGCDGVTYVNACIAAVQGENVDTQGVCALAKGVVDCSTDADCADPNLFCNHVLGCDGTGTCSIKPTECGALTPAVDTVCGCDHRTYLNVCDANSSGTSVASLGACVLPDGPCTSQADCGGDDYASVVYCAHTSCDDPAGICVQRETGCPLFYAPECSCGGATLTNDCFAARDGATVAYSGPCRSGDVQACTTSADCPQGSACVDDPRVDCSSGHCGGVCFASGSPCGPYTMPAPGGELDCLNGVCAHSHDDCDPAFGCGTCVYSEGVACDANNPCPDGELCVPEFSCGGVTPCPSACARP